MCSIWSVLLGAAGVVALGSIYAFVPETKGLSLEEITAMFEDGKGE
jgi:hypothetical protein